MSTNPRHGRSSFFSPLMPALESERTALRGDEAGATEPCCLVRNAPEEVIHDTEVKFSAISNQPKQNDRIIYQPIAAVREPTTVLAAVLVEYGLLKERYPDKANIAWSIVRVFGEAGFFVTRR